MSTFGRLFAAAVATALGTALVACGGGGGQGLRASANPIKISPTAPPTLLTGQIVNYCLEYTGGSGGPYVLEVIDGTLPTGLKVNSSTVCLEGVFMDADTFDFTLKLTDTGSQPFTSTTQAYHWVVGVGPLTILTDPNLAPWLYNFFDTRQILVAGGTPPYILDVVEDPADGTGPLPLGLTIPVFSTTILGSPVGTLPTDPPWLFKVALRATDSAAVPSSVQKVFTLTVTVPSLEISTASLPNGTCGQSYVTKVEVAGGVPPFGFAVVPSTGSKVPLLGEPGCPLNPNPGAVPKGDPASAYALESQAGPYTGKFPEGISIRDSAGDIQGVPRRAGAFNSWVVWVHSTSLGFLTDQNKWKTFSFVMADGQPPAVALDPTCLQSGSTFSATPPNYLPDMEQGVAYNVQLRANNGVKQDGKWDSPVESGATSNPAEVVNSYDWSGCVWVGGAPAGITLSPSGLISGTPTVKSGYKTLNVAVRDFQLPYPPAGPGHSATGTCQYQVGPDTVIVAQSSTGTTTTLVDNSYDYGSQTMMRFIPTGVAQVTALNDSLDMATTHTNPTGSSLSTSLSNIDFMSVSVNATWWAYDPYQLCALGARAVQHADPQRTFNSQGYLNAAQFRHSEYQYTNGGAYYTSQYNMTLTNNTVYEHPSNNAIEIPEYARYAALYPQAVTVTHDPSHGIYTDGGLLYAWDSATQFGFVIVRKDGKIEIPFALNKTDTIGGVGGPWAGFGDAVLTSDRTKPAVWRVPQITVSPDGRFAAVKLKASINQFNETASSGGEAIALFCLSGEKPANWGSKTYRVVSVDASLPGTYFYGDSMALTNKYLYFLRGDYIGGPSTSGSPGDAVIYSGHYVYRMMVDSSSDVPALLASNYGGAGSWSNMSGSPLSTTFHRWSSPGTTSVSTPQYGPRIGTSGQANSSPTDISPDFYAYQWANFAENSSAPVPFRVSADGKACAIIGGSSQSFSSGNPLWMSYGLYVDYDGTFRAASGIRRKYKGASRSSGFRVGDVKNGIYGTFDGPANQFEISDDGKVVACVYRVNQYYYPSGPSGYTFYEGSNVISNYSATREDIMISQGTSASTSDPWSSSVLDVEITQPTWTTSSSYPGYLYYWRFGCLAFTRDNKGLAFWGGYTYYALSNANYYQQMGWMMGSMYAFTFPSGISGSVTRQCIESSNDGGAGISSSLGANGKPADANSLSGSQGGLTPIGLFFGNDGKFFYVEAMGAIVNDTTTPGGFTPALGQTPKRLIGVRADIYDPTASANAAGRSALRAFDPSWPAGRAFGPVGGCSTYYFTYTYQPYYTGSPGYSTYANAYAPQFCGAYGQSNHRIGTAVSAGRSNAVFFVGYNIARTGQYQYYFPWGSYIGMQYNYTYYSTSVPDYTHEGPLFGTEVAVDVTLDGQIFAFDAGVGGPVVKITNNLTDIGSYSGGGSLAGSFPRFITYIQPNPTGKSLAIQYTHPNTSTWPSTSPYYGYFSIGEHNGADERLAVYTNINFAANGTLANSPVQGKPEPNPGRAGPSMAFSGLDYGMYYAFKQGGSNENAMDLAYIATNPDGSQGAKKAWTGLAARYAILAAGR